MSRAVRPPSRRPRLAALALVLAVVALLGACTHQRQIPDKYGDTTERNFIEGCIDSLTQRGNSTEGASQEDLGGSEPLSVEQARELCTCSYEGISGEDGIPYERFKEIMADQEEEPAPLPREVLDIVEGCRSEVAPA